MPNWYKTLYESFNDRILKGISSTSDHNAELTRRYVNEMGERKKLHNQLVELKGNIRVFCRVRPLHTVPGSQRNSMRQVLTFDDIDNGVIFVHNRGNSKSYNLDRIFLPTTTQAEVFEEVMPLVTSVVDGYNLCIFAYGQTGSGKTYTMEGHDDNPGINQRALNLLFTLTKERLVGEWEFELGVSVLEIYNENVFDLLSDNPTEKLNVMAVTDANDLASLEVVSTVNQLNGVLVRGRRNRQTAATNMNKASSRSHALVCIQVKGQNKITG